MRTGICTTDLETMPAEKLFTKLNSLGTIVTQLSFASVEETGFVPDGNIEIPECVDKSVLELIKACASKCNVEIAAVNGTFNMAHPDADVRKEGLRRFEGFAQALTFLGCGMISLCSGTRNSKSLWAPHPENGTEEAWQDMFETVTAAVKIAERLDIVLAVETEAANIIDTPEKARRLMDEIGSKNLKMIMDCANLFHIGEAHAGNVRTVMCHAFELFVRDVVIAHGKDIKESNGIEFCGTGEGIVDFEYFAELLRDYGYKGVMFLHGIYEENKLPAALTFFNFIDKQVCSQ
ncbi:MAG: sugar phosphate isomerase/epimerase family protein [Eubacteriales bacterium]